MAVKDFVKILREIDPSKDNYTKFRDFLTLAYCALAKTTEMPDRADAFEEEYMRVVGQYRNKDDIRRMLELLAITAMQADIHLDFLGSVAGELEILNADAGQFFTPYEVCRLMAELTCSGLVDQIEQKGFATMQEPACGAGAMILAVADTLAFKGYDPATSLWIEAIDVADMPHKMCFIQLTYRGLAGRVWRGNTLSMEMFEVATLPGSLAFTEKHGSPFPAKETPAEQGPAKEAEKAPNEPTPAISLPAAFGEQMTLL